MHEINPEEGPDIQQVVAQYRSALAKRVKLIGPVLAGVAVLATVWGGTYSVDPGEIGVVRRFGQMHQKTAPGLHFRFPIIEKVDVVNVSMVRRAEIGFRSTKSGPKRVDSEALMLTGDENIVEAQMIVQFKVADPVKYLFRLKNPEKTLHIAAEVALRGVVGQTIITTGLEDLNDSPAVKAGTGDAKPAPIASGAASAAPASGAASAAPVASAAPSAKATAKPPKEGKTSGSKVNPMEGVDQSMDILTTGRERAQVSAKIKLQQLMDLYESGLQIVEVKLQTVDAPDEVKDAFHDVVRAREEREKKINKALGYRQDRIPRARGQAKKILRAAEAYKIERIQAAKGATSRFTAILLEYRKARRVTRERLHLETVERILKRARSKVIIDVDIAKGSVPILPLMGGGLGPILKGGK